MVLCWLLMLLKVFILREFPYKINGCFTPKEDLFFFFPCFLLVAERL